MPLDILTLDYVINALTKHKMDKQKKTVSTPATNALLTTSNYSIASTRTRPRPRKKPERSLQ